MCGRIPELRMMPNRISGRLVRVQFTYQESDGSWMEQIEDSIDGAARRLPGLEPLILLSCLSCLPYLLPSHVT